VDLVIDSTNLTQGQTVRILRITQGWTQADLAAFAGVGVGDVSHLELDRRVRPNAVSAILEALGMET